MCVVIGLLNLLVWAGEKKAVEDGDYWKMGLKVVMVIGRDRTCRIGQEKDRH